MSLIFSNYYFWVLLLRLIMLRSGSGTVRYGTENSFRRREKAASTRAARIVVVFLVIRVDNSHGKLCFGLFFVKFLGINSA